MSDFPREKTLRDRVASLLEEHSFLVLSLINDFPERHALLEGVTLLLVVRAVHGVSLIFVRRRGLYFGQRRYSNSEPILLRKLWLSLNCKGKAIT